MEKMKTIEKLNKSIDFENLVYYYKGPTANVDFNHFIDAETYFDEINFKRIKLFDAEKNQMEIK